jgi:hypothetical protein
MAASEGAKAHDHMTRLERVTTHHILKKEIEKLITVYRALHHPCCYISFDAEGCYKAIADSTAKGCIKNCLMTRRSSAMHTVECAIVLACLVKAYNLAGK